VFYQDSKGQFGFNEYRMRSAEARGNIGVVFVAYSLLQAISLAKEIQADAFIIDEPDGREALALNPPQLACKNDSATASDIQV
jgi:hypothetical protein